jgi:hypothetical protein
LPLPQADCPENISADVCCTSFWLVGERIRTVAYTAVLACLYPGEEDPEQVCDGVLTTWQTHGPRIEWPHGESLVVTFLRATPKISSRERSGPLAPVVVTRAEYLVELRENGWPILTTDPTQTIHTPQWEMYYALAKHASGHGEKMWRALVNAASTTRPAQRMFNPTTNPYVLDKGVLVNDLVPLDRPGPQAGWKVTVTVDMKML